MLVKEKVVEQTSPEERLISRLPDIASDLNTLWARFASRSIGFAGAGQQAFELGPKLAGEVEELLEGCNVRCDKFERNREMYDWGEMVISLGDVSSGLKICFGPSWQNLTDDDRDRTLFRMDMGAQRLLKIFTERGYIQIGSYPFELRKNR